MSDPTLPWGGSAPLTFGANPEGPSEAQRATAASLAKKKKTNLLIAVLLALVVVVGTVTVLGKVGSKSDAYVLKANSKLSALSTLTPEDFTATGVALGDVVASADLPATLPASAQEVDDLYKKDGIIIADNQEALVSWAKTVLPNYPAQYDIDKNQQLTGSMLAAPAGVDNGSVLSESERLISIQADLSMAVSGTLQAGDHVSVWAVYRASTGDSTSLVSGMVLEDAEIVGVQLPQDILRTVQQNQVKDGSATAPSAADLLPGMYTLKINADDQARMAVVAGGEGVSIVLVYKPANAKAATPAPTSIIAALCAYNNTSPVCTG